ncbi:hypothetical protein EON65_23690 [archaeon]|nr:MAG: hypothetical protein EON65_23690 [archaeon]
MDFQENLEVPEDVCYSQSPYTKNPRGGSPTSIISLPIAVEDNEEETRHIFRMMELADRTSLPYSTMASLASDPCITNRTSMVEWMMGEV